MIFIHNYRTCDDRYAAGDDGDDDTNDAGPPKEGRDADGARPEEVQRPRSGSAA